MPERIDEVIDHASLYLQNAQATLERGPPFRAIAYDEARHAVELGCKALPLAKLGSYPKRGAAGHRVSGIMAREGLVPRAVEIRTLNRTLDHHTRGAYGFSEAFTEHEIDDVIALGHAILDAARAWPQGSYWPPEPAPPIG